MSQNFSKFYISKPKTSDLEPKNEKIFAPTGAFYIYLLNLCIAQFRAEIPRVFASIFRICYVFLKFTEIFCYIFVKYFVVLKGEFSCSFGPKFVLSVEK